MAYRVTAEEVSQIIEVDSGITTLTPFIATANDLVTELCSGSGYSVTKLALIELWLSAHFYAVRDPRLSSEKAGVDVAYQHKIDMRLAVTTYGQQAMLIDTAGSLAALNERTGKGARTVGVVWLGTDLSDATAE